MAISYKDAGVDVERGYEAVRLMKEHVKKPCAQMCLGIWAASEAFTS